MVIRASVGQPVDERWITMKREDDRFALREKRIEVMVAQTMRVLTLGLKSHQVDDINDANLQCGTMPAKQIDSGQRLQRGHVATTGHDYVRFTASIIAGPVPDADTRGAVFNCLFHGQPLGSWLLS